METLQMDPTVDNNLLFQCRAALSIAACKRPLNPPTPSNISWDIVVILCGGAVVKLASNISIDSFPAFQHNTTLPNWMQFDTVNHTFYILPTHSGASSFNNKETSSKVIYRLTSTDSS